MELISTSGNITLKDSQFKQSSLFSYSGNVLLETVHLTGGSGQTETDQLSNQIFVEGGNLTANQLHIKGNYWLTGMHGDIQLDLADDTQSDIAIEASNQDGNIDNRISSKTESANKLFVFSQEGDLTIR